MKMQFHVGRVRPFFLSAALCLGFTMMGSGCAKTDPLWTTVRGTVSFNGQQVDHGEIVFIPERGVAGQTVATVIKDGKFELVRGKSPRVGEHRIEIYAQRKTGKMIPLERPDGTKSEELTEEIVDYIPRKYNEKSELRLDVTQGVNTREIELTGPEFAGNK